MMRTLLLLALLASVAAAGTCNNPLTCWRRSCCEGYTCSFASSQWGKCVPLPTCSSASDVGRTRFSGGTLEVCRSDATPSAKRGACASNNGLSFSFQPVYSRPCNVATEAASYNLRAGGRCYAAFAPSDGITAGNAHAQCLGLGGNLAVPNSPARNDAIEQVIKCSGADQAWVGVARVYANSGACSEGGELGCSSRTPLSDPGSNTFNRGWRYATGEVSRLGTANNDEYWKNWGANVPRPGDDENCAVMWGSEASALASVSGQWASRACDEGERFGSKIGYVCEFPDWEASPSA